MRDAADGGHHLARDEEDAGADDDADDDGGRVGRVEDAREVAGGVAGLHGWVESSTDDVLLVPAFCANRVDAAS